MKAVKGEAGYIRSKKRQETGKTCVQAALVLAVFLAGYVTTKTRLNWMTVFAVLGVLPAARSLVGVIMLLPRHSVCAELVQRVEEHAPHLIKAYDMVITSYEHVMPVDSIVIFGNIVCGYSSDRKIRPEETAAYLKKMLHSSGYEKASVKLFTDTKAYMARIDGMENMAKVEKKEDYTHEEGMRQVILTLSM